MYFLSRDRLWNTVRHRPQRSARLISRRANWWPLLKWTYSKGDSLDGTNGVTAIARIAGAAQYLMTIHVRVITRETLDHRTGKRVGRSCERDLRWPCYRWRWSNVTHLDSNSNSTLREIPERCVSDWRDTMERPRCGHL